MHHGGADAVEGEQRGLDLAGFDPVAADLHLVVAAAEDLQRAVRAEPAEVAGGVEPAAGPGGVRVGEEDAGGLGGPPPVPPGEAVAADADVPGDALGHRLQPVVEHPDGGVVHRGPLPYPSVGAV